MKKLLSFILAAALAALSGCSFVEDGNTKSDVDATLVPAQDIYKNAEKALAKSYKAFSFDEGIALSGETEIYTLTLGYSDPTMDMSILKAKGEEIAKCFEGESFDEKNGEIVSDFRYDYRTQESYYGLDIYDGLYLGDEAFLTEFIEAQAAKTLDAQITDLRKKNAPAPDMSGNDFYQKVCKFTGELEPVFCYDIAFSGGASGREIIGGYAYKGVPIDYSISAGLIDSDTESEDYLNLSFQLFMKEDSKPCVFWSQSRMPRVVSSERVDKLISFEGAVNILDDVLAENSDYEFSNAELCYCSKYRYEITYYTDLVNDTSGSYVFEPVWVFYIAQESPDTEAVNQPSSVRVNALSGEVTVAIHDRDKGAGL